MEGFHIWAYRDRPRHGYHFSADGTSATRFAGAIVELEAAGQRLSWNSGEGPAPSSTPAVVDAFFELVDIV